MTVQHLVQVPQDFPGTMGGAEAAFFCRSSPGGRGGGGADVVTLQIPIDRWRRCRDRECRQAGRGTGRPAFSTHTVIAIVRVTKLIYIY